MQLRLISHDQVELNGKPLELGQSLKYANHSPSGFSWGYAGSGPAQLSLAIMMEMLGDPKTWITQSGHHYQNFKDDIIAKLPQEPCFVELDFWGWFHGKKDYHIKVTQLGMNEPTHRDQSAPQCSKGWADRCAKSRGQSCRCQCGGANHGKNHSGIVIRDDQGREHQEGEIFESNSITIET